MLRAKIDLRAGNQASYSSSPRTVTFQARFEEHPVPNVPDLGGQNHQPMAIKVDPCEALAPTACLRPQRSCRVVWASVKAAYRSSRAVRTRQRHRYRGPSPSTAHVAEECLPCELVVLFIQSTRRHIIVAERWASLRVCA